MKIFKFSLLGLLVAQASAVQAFVYNIDAAEGTMNGGSYIGIYNSDILNANIAKSITGGDQFFRSTATLNVNATGALSGGNQWFYGSTVLNANAAESIVGGYRVFTDSSQLNVLTANAIGGAGQEFKGNSSLNLGADLSSEKIYLNLVSASSNFYLNGHSALIGFLKGAGTVQNGDLTIDPSVQGGSAFYGKLVDGAGQLSLTKQGEGRWTYGGDGSGMTGATQVIGGTLLVEGSLSNSAVTVYDGALLAGLGSVGATTVEDGGHIAPLHWTGNVISTLNVNNSLTLNAGSLYDIQIDDKGNSSRIDVSGGTGSVNLNGGTVNVLAAAGDYHMGSRYTILTTTGAITGTFAQAVDDLAFLDAKLMYTDPTKVELLLVRNALMFDDVAETEKQRDTAIGIASSGNEDLASTINALDAETARSAYEQLAGEAHASALSVLTNDQEFVRRGMSNRLYDGAGQGWWSKTEGDTTHVDGTADIDSMSKRRSSVLVGFDRQLDNTAWNLGLLAGYSNSALNTSRSDIKINTYHLGAYAGTAYNKVQVRLGASGDFSQLNSKRDIAFGAYQAKEKSEYDATGVQGFAELGYKLDVAKVEVEPFINLAGVSVQRGAFKEKGDVAALQSDSAATFTTFTTLGSRLRHSFILRDRAVELTGSMGLRHAQGDVTPVSDNRFVVGGDDFSIEGSPLAKDTLVYQAGVNTLLGKGVTLGVGYAGQSAKGSQSHSGQVEVKWAF